MESARTGARLHSHLPLTPGDAAHTRSLDSEPGGEEDPPWAAAPVEPSPSLSHSLFHPVAGLFMVALARYWREPQVQHGHRQRVPVERQTLGQTPAHAVTGAEPTRLPDRGP